MAILNEVLCGDTASFRTVPHGSAISKAGLTPRMIYSTSVTMEAACCMPRVASNPGRRRRLPSYGFGERLHRGFRIWGVAGVGVIFNGGVDWRKLLCPCVPPTQMGSDATQQGYHGLFSNLIADGVALSVPVFFFMIRSFTWRSISCASDAAHPKVEKPNALNENPMY